MFGLLAKIFLVAFFLNLLYEMLHSVLYKTCWKARLPRYLYLILKGALFDGCVIVMIYFVSYALFPAHYLFIFSLTSLVFAYGWELYSLKADKWEYTPAMPKFFEVGITPIVQLAATGLLALYIVQHFFV